MDASSYTTEPNTTSNPYEHIVFEPSLPPSVKYLAVTLCFLAGLVGSFGNILVVLAIARTKKLRTSVNAFIASLALADLCNCMLTLPLIAVSFISLDILIGNALLCRLFYFISLTFGPVSVEHLITIAANRYILVNKSPKTYAKLFNKRTIPIMIALLWGSNILMNMVQSVLSYMEVNVRGKTYCVFEQKTPFNIGRTIFSLVVCFASCFIIVPTMYLLTFRTVHKSQVRVTQKPAFSTQSKPVRSGEIIPVKLDEPSSPPRSYSAKQTTGLNSSMMVELDGISNQPTQGANGDVAGQMASSNEQPNMEPSVRLNSQPRTRLSPSEIRIIRVNVIIFVTNILFLLPLLIVLSVTFGYVSHFQLILALLPIGVNSVINPLVYCGFNRNFRQAFKAILSR